MFDSLQDAIDLGNDKKNKDNDGGVPIFSKRAVAQRKGEEVDWEDVIWVTIHNKGDPKNVMERPKRKEDETRWPDHWKAFLSNEDPDIDGIPLEEFPQITPAERERCKKLHLRSVEDLANYPDGQIKDLGGRGHALQKAAREYVDYRAGESITDLKQRIAELEKVVMLQKDLMGNGTDSITNSEERSVGDQSASASELDERGAGLSGKGIPDIGNQLSSLGEDGLAGTD